MSLLDLLLGKTSPTTKVVTATGGKPVAAAPVKAAPVPASTKPQTTVVSATGGRTVTPAKTTTKTTVVASPAKAEAHPIVVVDTKPSGKPATVVNGASVTVGNQTYAIPQSMIPIAQQYAPVGTFAGLDYSIQLPDGVPSGTGTISGSPVAAQVAAAVVVGLRAHAEEHQETLAGVVNSLPAPVGVVEYQPTAAELAAIVPSSEVGISTEIIAPPGYEVYHGPVNPFGDTPLFVPASPASPTIPYSAPSVPSQAPYVPPPQIGPGGQNPNAQPTTTTVPPSLTGDGALASILEPKKLLIFAAIGLLTGIWLIGN